MLTMQNEGKSNCQIIHATTRFSVVMATSLKKRKIKLCKHVNHVSLSPLGAAV